MPGVITEKGLVRVNNAGGDAGYEYKKETDCLIILL